MQAEIVRGPRFLQLPELRLVGNGAELLTPLIYLDGRGRRFEVPAGFRTDFESVPLIIPGLIRWVLGDPWHTAHAGVLHDWLYWSGVIPRRDADAVFREALIALDELEEKLEPPGRIARALEWLGFDRGELAARLKWIGVRAGGWLPWRRHRARSI